MEKILFVIIGGIVGFLASIAKDYFVEKTKRKYKEIELKREKAEELYILLESWNTKFFLMNNNLVLVMKNQISYNDYLDKLIKDGENDTTNYKRIEMLISIYFKNLLTSYDLILNQRDILSNLQSEYKDEYIKGNFNGTNHIKPFLSEGLKLHEVIDKLKDEIASFISNLK